MVYLIPQEKGLIIVINRLEAIQNRYNEISNELSTPEVINDIKKMTELSKEQRRLSETVEIYKKYKGILSDIEAAKEMLDDKDMLEFAKEEISARNNRAETFRILSFGDGFHSPRQGRHRALAAHSQRDGKRQDCRRFDSGAQ